MRLLAAALLLVSVGSIVSETSAQNLESDYTVERFRWATDTQGILDVEWAAVPKHLELTMGIWMGYSDDPLNLYVNDDDGRERTGSLISSRLGGSLVGSLGLFGHFAIGLSIPLILSQDQDLGGITMSANSLSGAGLGDVRLVPKVTLLRQKDAGVHLGLSLGFSLPTSSANDYFGDPSTVFSPELLLSRSFENGFRVAANAGYRVRKNLKVLDLVVGDEFFSHSGVGYRFGATDGPPLELDLSYAFATAAADLFGAFNQNYSEVKIGAGYDIPGPLALFGAAGRGTTNGFGAPDWRVVVGLRLRSGDSQNPSALPLLADNDSEREGVLDGRAEANDSGTDGINHSNDACPNSAEDKDESDNHGVLDIHDECVNQVGSKGCAAPDRDNDSVADSEDNCPDELGSVEFKGCTKRQLVTVSGSSLDILDQVYFKTNKAIILNQSYELLDNVAEVLKNHAEIEKVRIEGHTDDRGANRYNKKLSQRRAEAVMAYLVSQGVKKSRLESEGFGEERPIKSNASDEGRSANRRVDFVIVGGNDSIGQKNSGPGRESMDNN